MVKQRVAKIEDKKIVPQAMLEVILWWIKITSSNALGKFDFSIIGAPHGGGKVICDVINDWFYFVALAKSDRINHPARPPAVFPLSHTEAWVVMMYDDLWRFLRFWNEHVIMCCKHCNKESSSKYGVDSALQHVPYGRAERQGRDGSGKTAWETQKCRVF